MLNRERTSQGPHRTGDPGGSPLCAIRTHRDIAAILGIGRARVFYHEQEALNRIRLALANAQIRSQGDFETVSENHLRLVLAAVRPPSSHPGMAPYSASHGWLRISRIVSLNGGSEDIEDIVRAFRFLKQTNETIVRPPVLLSTGHRLAIRYRVEALAEHGGSLRTRCWPIHGGQRTVQAIESRHCIAITESIFDSDDEGDFDIPILLCVMVSGYTRRV